MLPRHTAFALSFGFLLLSCTKAPRPTDEEPAAPGALAQTADYASRKPGALPARPAKELGDDPSTIAKVADAPQPPQPAEPEVPPAAPEVSWQGKPLSEWIGMLKGNDLFQRRRAAQVICQMGAVAEKAIPELGELLKDQDVELRRQAAQALAKMGPKASSVISDLREATNDDDASTRMHALSALIAIGPDAVPAVAATAANGKDVRVQRKALAALAETKTSSDEVLEALATVAGGEDLSMGRDAFKALGKIGAPSVPVLTGLLQHEEKKVGHMAAGVLGQLGAEASAAVPDLVRACSTNSYARSALSKIGAPSPDAIPALSTLVDDTDRSVREAAIGALGRAGQEAVPALVAALGCKDRSAAMQAAMALRSIGEAAVPSLIEALRNEDASVRKNAVIALQRMRPAAKDAAEALASLLRDPDSNVKHEALRCLGSIGAPAAGALGDALSTRDLLTRRKIVDTISGLRTDGGDAAPGLFELLLDKKNARDHMKVLFVLTRRMKSAAVPTLCEILGKDKRPEARRLAAQLLARMQPEDLQGTAPVLVEAMKDDDANISSAASKALSKIRPDVEAKSAPSDCVPGKMPEETFKALVSATGGKTPEKILGLLSPGLTKDIGFTTVMISAAQTIDEARLIKRGGKGEAGKAVAELQYSRIGMTLDDVASATKERMAGAFLRPSFPSAGAKFVKAETNDAGDAATVSYTTAKGKAQTLSLVLVDGRWYVGQQ